MCWTWRARECRGRGRPLPGCSRRDRRRDRLRSPGQHLSERRYDTRLAVHGERSDRGHTPRLYDRFIDGFTLAHPIGLWDDTGALLAQETIGPGIGDLLLDNFQYQAIGDITNERGTVILTPGIDSTIAFYTSIFVQSDGMVIFDGFHTINPVVNYVGFGLSEFTDGLQMPTDPDPGFHHWGPNFLFDVVVPAPAAVPLLGGAVDDVGSRGSQRS